MQFFLMLFLFHMRNFRPLLLFSFLSLSAVLWITGPATQNIRNNHQIFGFDLSLVFYKKKETPLIEKHQKIFRSYILNPLIHILEHRSRVTVYNVMRDFEKSYFRFSYTSVYL